MNLSPARIEDMIATAERRALRIRTGRRAAAVAVSLAAMGAVALGGWALMLHDQPLVASPAPSPNQPTSPNQTPSPTPAATPSAAPMSESPAVEVWPTEWPSAPEAAYVDFVTAYSPEEQQLVLERLATGLEGMDTSNVWAVVTRTTWEDGLNALSPDGGEVQIMGADDTPSLTLRVGGPLGAFQPVGTRFHRPKALEEQDEPIEEAEVAWLSHFGLDGQGYSGGVQYLQLGGEVPVVPPVDPALETEPALVPLKDVADHLPG